MPQGTQLVREGLAGSNGATLALAGPGDVTADSVSVVIDRRPEQKAEAHGGARPRLRRYAPPSVQRASECPRERRDFFPLPIIPMHPALSLHGDVP